MERNEEILGRIEELLERPYRVIDILPYQVPAGNGGNYFQVEEHYLKDPQKGRLRQRFAEVLLKLNCYYPFLIYLDDGTIIDAPSPEKLEKLILQNEDTVDIVLESVDALITVRHDDTYMTVYNADEKLLDTVKALAMAEGLFLWKPDQK